LSWECRKCLEAAIKENRKAKKLNGRQTPEGRDAYERKATLALRALSLCTSCKSGEVLNMRPHRKVKNAISVLACEPLRASGFECSFHLCADTLLEVIEEEYEGREEDKRDLYDLVRRVMREVLGVGTGLSEPRRQLYRRYILHP